MSSHLWSLFLATTAINSTPNIWTPLGNGFFSSYSATKLLLACLITIKATLISLLPPDTSYDTAYGRFPTQNLLPGFLHALFLLPVPRAPLWRTFSQVSCRLCFCSQDLEHLSCSAGDSVSGFMAGIDGAILLRHVL